MMTTTGTDKMTSTGLSDKPRLDLIVQMLTADCSKLIDIMSQACKIRDKHFGKIITYSRKVFIPLTNVCSNDCLYCNFSRRPWEKGAFILRPDVAVELVKKWEQKFKIKEVLVCTGERPDTFAEIREKLKSWGFRNFVEYLCEFLYKVITETRYAVPHVNVGYLTIEELKQIRDYTASVGIMLEIASPRLCTDELPHKNSPSKHPKYRIDFIRACERVRIPVTTGTLIGICETTDERARTLLILHSLTMQLECIQEVIVQNYMPGPRSATRCTCCEPPTLTDMVRTIATTRLLVKPDVSVQAPPNLALGAYGVYILAGANDWGGVSPVTIDYVNPTYPWPSIRMLKKVTESLGYELRERLPVYPKFIKNSRTWLSDIVREKVHQIIDDTGLVDKKYEGE